MARQDQEIDEKDSSGGAATVMVGGMDDLIPGGKGKAEDNLEVEVEDPKPPGGRPSGDLEEDEDRRRRASRRDVDDDARLAYDTDDDDEVEERGLSRRQRRNRSRRVVVAGRDQEISSLYQRLDHLTNMINQMGQSQVGLTIQNIDSQLGAAQQAFNLADGEMKKASAEGNLARYEELRNLKDEARAQLYNLNQHKGRIQYNIQQNQARAGRPPAAPPPTNKRAQDFTETFMSRFPDFDPNGADESSLVMKAIDDSVAAEGYRPDTPMYWRVLEQKLAARGIYPDTDDDDDDAPPRREERRPVRRANGGGRPPTAGGSNNRRGTGTTFRLDPMARDYLESEGILHLDGLTDEQKARRTRLINDWREGTRRMNSGG